MTLLTKAKQLHDQGFSVIPTNIRKAPVIGTGWQEYVDDNRIEPNGNFVQANVKGVGVVLGAKIGDHYLAAIDVDCYNKTVSRMMCDYIAEQSQTGTITYRVGQPPKFLVPYLSPTQVKKTVSSSFNSGEEKDSKIERLGKGQQFVAYGKQEKGEYKWYNGELDINTLPVFDEVDIAEMMVVFEQLAEKYGMAQTDYKPINPFGDDDEDPFATIAKPPLDLTKQEVIDTLKDIDPASLSYQEWVNVGMALHHQYGGNGEAYDIWNIWSKQDKDRYKADEMRFKWDSFGNSERAITFATVIAMSKKVGPSANMIVAQKEDNDLFQVLNDDYQDNAQHIVEWTIKPVLEHRVIANLYGPSGVGKSYLAIDMAMAVATGTTWNGGPVRQGKVLYLCGEGHKGVNRRVKAWRMEHGGQHGDNMIISKRAMNLTDKKDVAAVVDMLNAHQDIELIVVDTLGRALSGKNENDAQDVQPVLDMLDVMAKTFNCTIMVVHHTPKHTTQDSAGSKNIRASMDVELAVESVAGEENAIKLLCRKMKEGDYFDPMGFRFKKIQLPANYNDEYGDATYSAVIERDAALDDKAKDASVKISANGKRLIEAYEACMNDTAKRVSTTKAVAIEYGLDAPSQGVFEELVRDEFYRRLGESSNPRQAYGRAKDNVEAAGKLGVRDDIFIELPKK